MTLAEIKRHVQPGQIYDVTNHYITRTDHSAFGTTRRTVTRITGSRIYLTYSGGGESGIDWPNAPQVSMDANGVIQLRGGGTGQQPGELFLTLTPVPAENSPGAESTVLLCDGCFQAATGLLAECRDGCRQDLDHTGLCLQPGPDECQCCGRTDRLHEVSRADTAEQLPTVGEDDEGQWFLRWPDEQARPLPVRAGGLERLACE
jgi:hypothetical protein